MKSPHKSLAIVAGAVLLIAGCGDSSGQNSSHSPSTAAAANRSVDRAFIAQMSTHHRSAVQMAKIAQRRGTSAYVKQLADDIVRTQTQEIATMRTIDQRLRRAGVKKGSLGVSEHMMGMDGDLSTLKKVKAFDRAFLRMMIPHHEGAVVMAKAELARGQDRELKALAQTIITTQQREIRAMRRHLRDPPTTARHDSDSTHGAASPTTRGADLHQRQAARELPPKARDMPHASADR